MAEISEKYFRDFINSKKHRDNYFEIMNSIFEELDDDDMAAYLAEEIDMQNIIEKQEKADDPAVSEQLMHAYYDLVLNSKFRPIRKQIMKLEKEYFDTNITDLIKIHKKNAPES